MQKALKEIVSIPECKCLTLAAGEDGLQNPVRWTVSTETVEYIDFVDEGDFIFITGLAAHGEEELLNLVSQAYSHKASGIVFAPGLYIASVPQAVIDFGNLNRFPIFIMPWEVKISSLTFAIGEYLLKNTDEFRQTKEILKSILLGLEPIPLSFNARRILNQYFQKNSTFRVLLFRTKIDRHMNQKLHTKEEEAQRLKQTHTSIIKEISRVYTIETVPIELPEGVAFLLVNKSSKDVIKNEVMDEVIRIVLKIQHQFQDVLFNIGLGNQYIQIEDIGKSYEEAELVTELFQFAEQQRKSMYCYDQLGAYQVISECFNLESMERFCREVLSPLESNDTFKQDDYISFLRDYFDFNGNIGEISKQRYLHRNTILYRMKKIEKILNFSFCNLDDLLNIRLALIINEVLKQKTGK